MLHSGESDIHPQDLIGALKRDNNKVSRSPAFTSGHQRSPAVTSVHQRSPARLTVLAASIRRVTHLKDGQDATVSEVALIRVVLGVSQPSEDLKSLADTNPASLRAEHLHSKQSHSRFRSGTLQSGSGDGASSPSPWQPRGNSPGLLVCPSSRPSGRPCSPSQRHSAPSQQTSPATAHPQRPVGGL